MVDQIHFPRSLSPLLPTDRVKKVRRRRDEHRDPGFKKHLDQEKKDSETAEDEDSYVPGDQIDNDQPTADADAASKPSAAAGESQGKDQAFGQKIDVHA